MNHPPWSIGAGPWVSPQRAVDGFGWGYELRRGQRRRSIVVIIKRHAAMADTPSLADKTRIALKTKGRSAALEAARLDDPPHVVVLGTNGYARAPRTLERS